MNLPGTVKDQNIGALGDLQFIHYASLHSISIYHNFNNSKAYTFMKYRLSQFHP
jgi:hypothetical protein